MEKFEGVIGLPDDVYGRTLDVLEVRALPALHQFVTEMDEVTIIAVGRQGNEVKLLQINTDQGITAPPPDVPSRVRQISIMSEHHVSSQDLYSALCSTFDFECEHIAGTIDDHGYGQGQLKIGKFEEFKTIKIGE